VEGGGWRGVRKSIGGRGGTGKQIPSDGIVTQEERSSRENRGSRKALVAFRLGWHGRSRGARIARSETTISSSRGSTSIPD